MAPTRAQRTQKGKANYGKNYARGRKTEEMIARDLRRQGYACKLSPGSRGADITARKGNTTRKIQVKHLSSRALMTPEAARHRMRGEPFNVKRIAPGQELIVVDRDGRRYHFGRKK